MTNEQFERWKDFALRMARTCWTNRTRPGRDWIVDAVQDFFAGIGRDDIACFRDWDNSDPYPPGHRYHGTDFYGGERHPGLMCDIMSEWEDEIWNNPREYMTMRMYDRWSRLHDRSKWDEADELRREMVDRWAGPVRCCVRAGMDCACSPSMGVLGFTAGDIRRMYPEGVPDWGTNGEWDSVPIKGVIPGVGFVPGEPHSPKPFDEIPDNESVWL